MKIAFIAGKDPVDLTVNGLHITVASEQPMDIALEIGGLPAAVAVQPPEVHAQAAGEPIEEPVQPPEEPVQASREPEPAVSCPEEEPYDEPPASEEEAYGVYDAEEEARMIASLFNVDSDAPGGETP